MRCFCIKINFSNFLWRQLHRSARTLVFFCSGSGSPESFAWLTAEGGREREKEKWRLGTLLAEIVRTKAADKSYRTGSVYQRGQTAIMVNTRKSSEHKPTSPFISGRTRSSQRSNPNLDEHNSRVRKRETPAAYSLRQPVSELLTLAFWRWMVR